MLTLPEKILLSLAILITIAAAFLVARRIILIIARGKGRVDWELSRRRLISVAFKTITLQPVFRFRPAASFFHALVAWGFMYYLIVNLGDVLEAFLPGIVFLGVGTLGNAYRLGADVLSVAVLVGMIYFIIRRFILKPSNLTARQEILLHSKTRKGIRRDSAIVATFIMFHVGARFAGQSFKIANGELHPWQPFATLLSNLWTGWSVDALSFATHISFWVALGLIFAFFPYFLYSKHIHLFFAPINFLLKPERKSIGELDRLDFDDESVEQFGASHLEHLGWELLMDAYACIMCYRCQEVCPAYNTGKVLSPAAMEINKRYFLNQEGARLAKGEASTEPIVKFAIPTEAIWACTACGACIDICPVGNEPMRDILDIRRSLVLMENDFPEQLQNAFRGMERTLNPWSVSPAERMKWAEGLYVPTIATNPDPDLLWWVGCAPATDARAQKTARHFADILNAAGINFAVLGEAEQCTGDSARRSGNEFLFNELALANVELLNEVAPKRIVTTCPHCLHTIKNEYPAFGGNYTIIHHTELINELIDAGSLKLKPQSLLADKSFRDVTFHDPCYLGRQNDIIEEPRQNLEKIGAHLIEMPRNGKKSFCCGAGGAQMWKEEEHGDERVSANRFREAMQTGAKTLAVACPFCMIMLNDAKKDARSEMELLDIAEIVAGALDD
jgi:Fe-S oxidoreductase